MDIKHEAHLPIVLVPVKHFSLDVQKFYNKAKTKGQIKRCEGMKDLSQSAKTVRVLHAMFRQRLDQAVQARLIPYNPATGCKLPSKEQKEMKTLSAEKTVEFRHSWTRFLS